MKAPIRFRVLEYMSTVEKASPDDMMQAMKAEYGKERHFTKASFIDHAMSLKANGLLDDVHVEINDKKELVIFYAINDEGKRMLSKYMPKRKAIAFA